MSSPDILDLNLSDSEPYIRVEATVLRQALAGYTRKPRGLQRRLTRLTAKLLEFERGGGHG